MIYSHLFAREPERRVRAALIGAGSFGRAIVTQSPLIRRLDLCAVADLQCGGGRCGLPAGRLSPRIRSPSATAAARRWQALEAGQVVVVGDALLLMDLPLDVIASATRVPEAAALYAREAIDHGKHVVMIDKEADAVVGPMLKRRADAAGVVYTTDDGDQPGLLMGLVAWARELGMEVLCGGDLRDALYDPASGTVSRGGRSVIGARERPLGAGADSRGRGAALCAGAPRTAGVPGRAGRPWRPDLPHGGGGQQHRSAAGDAHRPPRDAARHRDSLRLLSWEEGGILSGSRRTGRGLCASHGAPAARRRWRVHRRRQPGPCLARHHDRQGPVRQPGRDGHAGLPPVPPVRRGDCHVDPVCRTAGRPHGQRRSSATGGYGRHDDPALSLPARRSAAPAG